MINKNHKVVVRSFNPRERECAGKGCKVMIKPRTNRHKWCGDCMVIRKKEIDAAYKKKIRVAKTIATCPCGETFTKIRNQVFCDPCREKRAAAKVKKAKAVVAKKVEKSKSTKTRGKGISYTSKAPRAEFPVRGKIHYEGHTP